jgi:putative ABC transport system ATP-binding protein
MDKVMSLIQLREITKIYPLGDAPVYALKDVDLILEKGEFLAVWGPSGSGKTTLLNLIGVIDEPSSGLLTLNGQDVSQLSDDQKAELRNDYIGYIFQHFNLIPVLSALENVMLPLQIKGLPSQEAYQMACHRLNQVELTDFLSQRPDKLSGGQQQRVAIARALVTNPAVIIADEPTANLDSKTAMKIVGLMRDLNRQEGTTFIFSTHDQRLLDSVFRLIHLQDGQIIED